MQTIFVPETKRMSLDDASSISQSIFSNWLRRFFGIAQVTFFLKDNKFSHSDDPYIVLHAEIETAFYICSLPAASSLPCLEHSYSHLQFSFVTVRVLRSNANAICWQITIIDKMLFGIYCRCALNFFLPLKFMRKTMTSIMRAPEGFKRARDI